MMMGMLEKGGIPVLTDGVRSADVDNPRGYYEFEAVKQTADHPEWVLEAQGRAVKMVSALLVHLPARHCYKVVFMRRAMSEVLASQRRMLDHRGEQTTVTDDAEMARVFKRHLTTIGAWIHAQPNVDVLYVSYNDALEHPEREAERVNAFLGGGLDVKAMASFVDDALYRNRGRAARGGGACAAL
jgi:hypothetical protein